MQAFNQINLYVLQTNNQEVLVFVLKLYNT